MNSSSVQIMKALTKDGKIVHISEVKRRVDHNQEYEKYYCPICNQELIPRKGPKNVHHFAHKQNCTDTWTHDKTKWHSDWQNMFPLEYQEITLKNENEVHRADVLYNNCVIEFQHSPISQKEFSDRNRFYNSQGLTVIWLFDIRKNSLYEQFDGYFWKTPFETFKDYVCDTMPVYVFFEFSLGEISQIRKLKALSKPYERIEFEEDTETTFDGEEYKEIFKEYVIAYSSGSFPVIPDQNTIYSIIQEKETYALIMQNEENKGIYLVINPKVQLNTNGYIAGFPGIIQGNEVIFDSRIVQIEKCNYPVWHIIQGFSRQGIELIPNTTVTVPNSTYTNSYRRKGPPEQYLHNSYTVKRSTEQKRSSNKGKYGKSRKNK